MLVLLARAVVHIDAVPPVELVDLPEHGTVRPPVAAKEHQHREEDRDDDPFQHSDEDDTERRDERKHDGRPADGPVAAQRTDIDQRERGGDHDRGERRLREVRRAPR